MCDIIKSGKWKIRLTCNLMIGFGWMASDNKTTVSNSQGCWVVMGHWLTGSRTSVWVSPCKFDASLMKLNFLHKLDAFGVCQWGASIDGSKFMGAKVKKLSFLCPRLKILFCSSTLMTVSITNLSTLSSFVSLWALEHDLSQKPHRKNFLQIGFPSWGFGNFFWFL
jgi:hypothetical protein